MDEYFDRFEMQIFDISSSLFKFLYKEQIKGEIGHLSQATSGLADVVS